jgi:aldehyde:ferredoxin oxidoreductase
MVWTGEVIGLMSKQYGWAGKILRIDLTTKRYSIQTIDPYKEFIGAKGINQYILFDEVPVRCDPYDPANIIAIGAGPLVGTLAPGACRTSIDTKNAITGGTSSSSCGGFFASELKFAGYDNVVITGKLDKLGYIFITNDQVKFVDATDYKGLTTWETERRIREELGDKNIRVLSIGIAGENLLRTSCIITDNGRAAAKGGTGGVMGSKNLKAIAVRGTGSIFVSSDNYLKEISHFYQKLRVPGIDRLRLGGTHYGSFEPANDNSSMPVRNNQEEYWDHEKVHMMSQKRINQLGYEKLRFSCAACPIYCSHFYNIGDFRCEGFENTNAMALGPKIGISSPEAVIRLHGFCNAHGIDSDCAGTEIAWAMELFEKGIINESDTAGLKLSWGDYSAAAELLDQIVNKRDFGAVFCDGIKKAAETIGRGSIYYAEHIKGQDVYEPMRAKIAWGFGISVAPKGGGHCEGAAVTEGYLTEEQGIRYFGIPTAGDRTTYEGKAELVKWHEQYSASINCVGMCYLTSMWACLDAFSPDDYARMLEITTGKHISAAQLMQVGLKVHNIEKAFNVLHTDLGRADDFPPDRYFVEELSTGPMKGAKFDRDSWDRMLSRYYHIHGWDNQGVPKSETLI